MSDKANNTNVIVVSGNITKTHEGLTSMGPGQKELTRVNNCKCKECKCTKNACNICKTQGCASISLSETISLIARINYKISKLSEKLHQNITLKYELTHEYETLDKLILLRNSIVRYKKRLIQSSNLLNKCNCDRKIQKIFENAKQLLGVGYSPEKSLYYSVEKNVPIFEDGLQVDDSNLNKWLIDNPYCAPVDQWEKLAHYVCGNLGIEIEVEEIKCNITFDIVKESLPIDLLAGLSISNLAHKNGKLNIRTSDQCKLDWEILVEEIDSCDVDFDVYTQLINNCNLSYDIIREAYDCGFSFSVDNGKYQLIGKNFTYDLSTINFTSPITTYSSLNLTGDQINPEINEEKLSKILSDYNLTSAQLKNLKG